jgi:DNA-binding winged helix-turn-helix (wHTH) protein
VSQPRTTSEAGPQRSVVAFGPFRLFPTERLIERSGTPVNLGGRALDIVLELVEQARKVVTKSELLAHVWQGVSVKGKSLCEPLSPTCARLSATAKAMPDA